MDQLEGVQIYDLLDAKIYGSLLRNPKILDEENKTGETVVIDEIQKLPSILDELQRLIQKKSMTFLLTGSSARKLKRKAVNLLGGRLWKAHLHPLVSTEIKDFDLLTYLNTGGLPHVYGLKDYKKELRNYVDLYLKEEIQQESIIRNVASFAYFLDLLGLSNGQEINYDSFAKDLGVSATTVRTYIEILTDTLVAFCLPGFTKTKKRKAISRYKFFFFDVGVANSVAKRGSIEEGSQLFGLAFEHFMIQEIRAYLAYTDQDVVMSYWRSTSMFEVDLILGNDLAIEFKSTHHIYDKHLKGLRALKEEGLMKRLIIVSMDESKRETADGIEIVPYKMFLKNLWHHKFFKNARLEPK